MTSIEAEVFDQERVERQDTIANSLLIDGASDAVMGESPQSSDSAYLDGYLAQLRSLIEDGSMRLQIRWVSDAYLAGAFDRADSPF